MPEAVSTALAYPASPPDEKASDSLAGITFPDPYQWLEAENEEVRAWQRAQADLAMAYTRNWPLFGRLCGHVARFCTVKPERTGALPVEAASRWFRAAVPPGGAQAQVLVSADPVGAGRVLFDPVEDDAEHTPFVSWIAPSPDGKTLALGVCVDGSERNRIRLIDVDSGAALGGCPSQLLSDNWTGGVQWLADSTAFFFAANVATSPGIDRRILLHRRDPVPVTQPVDIPWIGNETQYRLVVPSADGRYAVAFERMYNPIPVAVADLHVLPLAWRPFVTRLDGTVAGHVVGDCLIAVTDVGAPRGRLVSIPMASDTPNDTGTWRELVPQSEAVLRTVTPVGALLYLTEFVDTYARVRILDQNGEIMGRVPLPGNGAINELPFPLMNLPTKGRPERYVFGFSSLTRSFGIYCHEADQKHIETLQHPAIELDDAMVEDRWAISADGTRIPYHILRRAHVDPAVPQPTLIYGYGGFNVPLVPQFPGEMAAFVEVGGVYVHAHLRGGGEFGLDWWEGGRRKNKQNCYNDLFAIAEDLIAHGRCTPQMLAIKGGSNGGLLAGVAITQRPDLWAAAIPRVPRLDLIGSCRDAYGLQTTIDDRADIHDPEEVKRLASFSPYHRIREGVRYPAVFIDAGATDTRCPAGQARKFIARLQNASAGSAPILLHVWDDVGHGWATARDTTILQHSEWLAFLLRQFGMEDWA